MLRYEVQFLGRTECDYVRHMMAARSINPAGRMDFRTYFFGGVRGLTVLFERSEDRDALLRAVPRTEVVGTWERATPLRRAA